jgi:hypothetical protein
MYVVLLCSCVAFLPGKSSAAENRPKSFTLPASVPPEIVEFLWGKNELQADGYKPFLDLTAAHSPFGLVLVLTEHSWEPRWDITNPELHNTMKDAAAYAHQRGLRIAFDLDVRLARGAFLQQHPDQQQWMLRIRRFPLAQGRSVVARLQPAREQDHMTTPGGRFEVLAGRLMAVYLADRKRPTSADALAWCRQMDKGRPFFLRVSFNDPHTPVVPPAPYDTAIDPTRIHVPGPDHLPAGAPAWEKEGLAAVQSSAPLSAAQVRRMRQCYYGLVKFVDHEVARLLEGMKRFGQLENTIIVMCSDHGTHLGDHGLVQKTTFYEPVVNVPCFFRWPGQIAKGTVIDRPVSTISLLPTLLELCGLPVPEGWDGRSLAPALGSGREPEPQPVFSEINHVIWGMRRVVLVRDGAWKLSVARWPDWPAGTPCPFGALYNLERDPNEENNLYGAPETADTARRLLALIEARDATNAEAYR